MTSVDSRSQTTSKKCTSLIEESERISMSLVNIKYHQRVISRSTNYPIPKLKLNAQE